MVRRFTLTLALLSLAGCRPGQVNGVTGDLTFGAPRTDFETTIIGHPTTATVEVRNGGRASRTFKLTTSTPFSVDGAERSIEGGASVTVEVAFTPDTPGIYELLLHLASNDQSIDTTLAGLAALEPACAERGPCWTQVYDHSIPGCRRINDADGNACEGGTACLLTSQCSNGVCIGTPRVCVDGNACTTDSCDPDTGCVYFSSLARCAASSDPCKAPSCDPLTGCGLEDAPDGTQCGPSDCVTANICLIGVCKKVSVSDGATCGTPSPCQRLGLCAANACNRPNPDELEPSWTVWAPPTQQVLWDSIADRLNNVYWREREFESNAGHLVSVTSTGFRRFRVPISIGEQMALMEDVLILRLGSAVQARSINDGTLKWTKAFPLDPLASVLAVRTLARGQAGVVYVGVVRMDKTVPNAKVLDSSIFALSLNNGATLWEARLPGLRIDDQSTPVDESGYLYTGTVGAQGRRYFAISPQGQLRWSLDNAHANPAAVFGGRVYHWDHWLSETSNGAWVNATPPNLAAAGYPRLALGAISFAGTNIRSVPSCTVPQMAENNSVMNLVRVDPATSQTLWELEIAGPDAGGREITNTVLTSRATVLFSQPESYCGAMPRTTVLREISAQGQPNFSCKLPGTESYEGEGLLNDSRWVVKVRADDSSEGVRAIHLPGFALPVHGWATAWGSPARDNHAR